MSDGGTMGPESSRPTNLRREAEQRLHGRNATPAQGMIEADSLALIHELQVHQIELEMQNEELLRTQAALQQASDKYHDLFDFAPVGYFLLDRQGRIVDLNLAGAALLGLDRKTAVDRRLGQFVAMEQRVAFAEFCQRVVATDTKQTSEFKLLRNGEAVHVMVEAIAARDHQEQAGLCRAAVIDISEQKRSDEALALAKISAEQAQARAEAANHAKSQFLANMSHEIRTPMTAILGFADLLMAPDVPHQERSEFLTAIQRSGKALLELISDILDLSRIEADRLVLDRVDSPLHEIVADVLSVVQVRAEQKGLALEVNYEYPLPETIHTDPARLRQILINLIGNAVKFTERGVVRIAISCIRETGGPAWMQFTVSDTGVGIPADRIPELFQPFMQVDGSTSRRYGGTGLGLAISRRLATALGGRIEVTSELGRGSIFTLTIDAGRLTGVKMLRAASARPTAQDEPLIIPSELTHQGRLLLVEDDRDIQKVVSLFLKRMHLDIEIANDGQAACEMAEKSRIEGRPYSLILMDIQMPIVDGYEATRQLRAQGWQGPIIAMTAHAMLGDRERCLQAGCNEYLSKPCVATDLQATVARYLMEDTPAAGQVRATAP